MWDPEQYLAFHDHRGRPFYDLLAHVGARKPRRVVDLGCGPGNLTAHLVKRWPKAVVEALDSSPEMVAAARDRGVAADVGDVTTWQPKPDTDVVITNAVLQWVPDHIELLRRWLRQLPAQSWFAFQVPANFTQPSHVLIRELAAEYAELAGVLRHENTVARPETYTRIITESGAAADVWETTYLHRLTGPDPVLGWVAGTALRPVRAALTDERWAQFYSALASRLRSAYPPERDSSTLLPFRRIFAIAHRR